MKCILLPTDFSAKASHALKLALSIAGNMSAKLVLMHAYPIPYDFSSRLATELEEEQNATLAQLEKLQQTCQSHPLSDKISFEILSLPGDPISAIKKAAADLDAELIIMGTKGHSSLKERIFGSITAETMLLSRFPILAVPEEAKIDNISRIVYATDYDENDFENLVNLAAFARLYDAEIRIIHVVRQDSLREQILFEGFKTLVTRENIYHNIHHNMVVGEDFYESVNQYIQNCEGSVLAMTSDRKSIFEKLFSRSLTHHMLYHTHVPFLVLKPNSIL